MKMFERRKVLFKSKADIAVVSILNVLMICTYLFELFVILPKIYGHGFSSWHKTAHVVVGTWILVNALTSLWKFILINPGTGSQVMPSVLKPGWKYCWKCEANFPPRSHHCFYCDTCILVRDHHCVIGSNCVGYANRRYFMLAVFYMWFALLYSNLLNIDFVWELYHSLQFKAVLTMFMPLFAYIFNLAEGENLLMATFTSFCMIAFLYATAMLLYHTQNTLRGRSTSEVAKSLGMMYDLGLVENLEETFGVNWKIGWIFPLIPSPLPGDGISFRTKDIIQHSGKDL